MSFLTVSSKEQIPNGMGIKLYSPVTSINEHKLFKGSLRSYIFDYFTVHMNCNLLWQGKRTEIYKLESLHSNMEGP